MQIVQHFYIGTQYLGQTERKKQMVHATLMAPESYAYFCPTCGEVWARAPVSLDGETQPFRIVGGGCKKHQQHGLNIPGSLWVQWEPEYNDALPNEVLQWEVQRHLDYIEAKHGEHEH